MKSIQFIAVAFLVFNLIYVYPVAAVTENHNDPDYFQVFEQVQKVPPGYTALAPIDAKETKSLYQSLTFHKLNPIGPYESLKGLSKYGNMYKEDYYEIVIYKGDFDNSDRNEYVFITESGSAHIASFYFYVFEKGQFKKINFDKLIKNNFSTDSIFNLFWWYAKPFVIKKDNLTYLRFMNGPGGGMNYDSSRLIVCTYLWQGNTIKFIHEAKKDHSARSCPKPVFKLKPVLKN